MRKTLSPRGRRPPFPPGRRPLHGFVAHELALAIIGGRYAPGDLLATEEQFSAALSVSRTAYREAVRILVAKGLVQARPKVGTRVQPRSQWNLLDPDVLSWHLEIEPRRDFVAALFELRRIVEPAAAAMAAERRKVAHLSRLADALAVMETADRTMPASLDADLTFHRAILDATGNEPLIAMSDAIAATLRWTGKLTLTAHPRALTDALNDHKAVLDAIERRDPDEACRLMCALVDIAQRDTLSALGIESLEKLTSQERG
jgi:DNA-binding FadR family transcriptional regulator